MSGTDLLNKQQEILRLMAQSDIEDWQVFPKNVVTKPAMAKTGMMMISWFEEAANNFTLNKRTRDTLLKYIKD